MKAEKYNKIPDHLKKTLGREEIVTYVVLNKRDDPDNPGMIITPRFEGLPATERIYDEKTGKYIPIAFIEDELENGEAIFGDISFESINGGMIVLNGQNPKDAEKYQHLELSNYNKSNPNRSTFVQPLFERVDEVKDAVKERSERKLILEAQLKVSDLSSEKLLSVASILGLSSSENENVLRNTIEKMAAQTPAKVLSILSERDDTTEIVALIKESLTLEVLNYDGRSKVFSYKDTGLELFKYSKDKGEDPYLVFANYLINEDKEALDSLKKRINAEIDSNPEMFNS